jgi:hypothetical protein
MQKSSINCRKCFQPGERINQEAAPSLQLAIHRLHQLMQADHMPMMCQQDNGSHWVCHSEARASVQVQRQTERQYAAA